MRQSSLVTLKAGRGGDFSKGKVMKERVGKISHISELVSRYRNKLQDPKWQKLRLKRMELSGWKCDECGDESTELQVHHKWYLKGKEPWDYRLEQLATLCDTCHKWVTEWQEEFKQRLSTASFYKQLTAGAAIGDYDAIECVLSRYDECDRVNARVAKCYAICIQSCPSLLFNLMKMHDHKGCLEVHSKVELSAEHIFTVRDSWLQCDECQTEFFCEGRSYFCGTGKLERNGQN
jgi:ribosomal protein L37AE/L43A